MTFNPADPTPVYQPEGNRVWVEDRRFPVGNLTSTNRKPATRREIDRLMRTAPTGR